MPFRLQIEKNAVEGADFMYKYILKINFRVAYVSSLVNKMYMLRQ